jgi:hypothetical protein
VGKGSRGTYHAIIKKVESVPGAKGATEEELLEVRAGFLEDMTLRKVGVKSLLSSLGFGLQAGSFRGLSDT